MSAKTRKRRARSSTAEPTSHDYDERSGLHEYRYANGLTLLVGPRHSAPIVCSMIWYRTGSAREQQGQTGVSHFLEHLMFKGTRRLGKGLIDKITQSLGGRNNAFTSRDYTSYFFVFASDRWEKALEIEADRMSGCLFDPVEFAAERNVVLEELRCDQDSPWGALDQELRAVAYRYHPYRHPILGWQEDIERFTPESVRAYYRQHYHPANAIQVVCGDVEPDRVAQQVGVAYAHLRSGQPSLPLTGAEPPQKGERRVVVESDHRVPRLQMVFHTAPFGHADYPALEVVEALLAEGKSSRLVSKLVEQKQLMRFIDTYNEAKREQGLFWVYGDLSPEVPIEKAERALIREIERVGTGRITHREIEKVRNQISTGFLFSMERIYDWAEMVGRFAVLGDHRLLGRYLDGIQSVTADDLQRVACKYFTRRNRTVGLGLPYGARG